MTRRAALIGVLIAAATTCGFAGDDGELKKVIAQAKKVGKAEELKKRTAWTVVTKSMQLNGEKQSNVNTVHVQLPDRVWSEIEMTKADKKKTILVVVNGPQGWRKEGG